MSPVMSPALRAAARGILGALLLVALLVAPTVARGATPLPKPACSGDPSVVRDLVFDPNDPTYNGLYVVPRGRPQGLVVFAHGHGQTPLVWQDILRRVATNDGVIAVAMEYPGTRFNVLFKGMNVPVFGWRVQEGADNSIRAAQLFESRCRNLKTIVDYGVSMGGNTSGLIAAAGAKRRDGRPLFDLWFDIEGVTNLTEQYLEARLIAPAVPLAALAQAEIEEETGGPIEAVPQQYARRTVVARAQDIAAAGVRGVVMVHSLADGQVAYNQTQEMALRLQQVGIPADVYSVVTHGPSSDSGTTLDQLLIPVPHDSPFSGHGFEGNPNNIVVKTGLDHLDAMLQGREPFPSGFHERIVDGTLGTTIGL